MQRREVDRGELRRPHLEAPEPSAIGRDHQRRRAERRQRRGRSRLEVQDVEARLAARLEQLQLDVRGGHVGDAGDRVVQREHLHAAVRLPRRLAQRPQRHARARGRGVPQESDVGGGAPDGTCDERQPSVGCGEHHRLGHAGVGLDEDGRGRAGDKRGHPQAAVGPDERDVRGNAPHVAQVDVRLEVVGRAGRRRGQLKRDHVRVVRRSHGDP